MACHNGLSQWLDQLSVELIFQPFRNIQIVFPSTDSIKLPRPVLDTILVFPPNRDILGGVAYFLQEASGNILIDCPAWDETNQQYLQDAGGIRWLVLTHRGGMGRVSDIQQAFDCQIVVQEQEAYLLPKLQVTSFHHDYVLSPQTRILWTPGHSPGSACVYCDRHSGVLFTGRHLLPNQQGEPVPLHIAKTFHWPRQLQSVAKLRQIFTADTLNYICPGANTGFLRGQRYIAQAYDRLCQLDLEALRQVKPAL